MEVKKINESKIGVYGIYQVELSADEMITIMSKAKKDDITVEEEIQLAIDNEMGF
jgi:hypothetical protein